MIWLNMLSTLINILNNGGAPWQIAGGAALGFIIGTTPSFFMDLLVFFVLLVVNVNLGAATFAIAIFKLLAHFIDPLLDVIGYRLLTSSGLHGFWTALYNTPLVPFTKFNNTIVLGSFVCSVIAAIPLFFLARAGVAQYRAHVMGKLAETKFMKAYKMSGFYQWYRKVMNIRNVITQ